MASESFTLVAEPREERGSAAVRRLRRIDDKVPGTVYGAHKDPQAILLSHKDLTKTLENEAVFSHILTLKIGSTSQKVVLKALQRHPHKPRINHVDLLRVKADEKITMTVPIHYLGEDVCPAIKDEGAVASHLISEVEIKCLPADLPTAFEIDVSHLKMDESLHLSDIKLPSGVEFAHIELDEEHDQAIMSVHMPKVSKEDIEAEAAEAALAEEASADAAEGDATESEGEKAEGADSSESQAGDADKKADDSSGDKSE